jgi:hypothetical protein
MPTSRSLVRLVTVAAASAAVLVSAGTVAMADDHLFNGATSPGADQRGFANPVAHNPSGKSGAAAQPATVPGLGNPKAGNDQGTPAFSCATLQVRLEARANGVGPSCE